MFTIDVQRIQRVEARTLANDGRAFSTLRVSDAHDSAVHLFLPAGVAEAMADAYHAAMAKRRAREDAA